MDDAALRSWVSDQLFALLGFAESALVAVVIALGAPPAPLRLCLRFTRAQTAATWTPLQPRATRRAGSAAAARARP